MWGAQGTHVLVMTCSCTAPVSPKLKVLVQFAGPIHHGAGDPPWRRGAAPWATPTSLLRGPEEPLDTRDSRETFV